jgi:hypothetical protein
MTSQNDKQMMYYTWQERLRKTDPTDKQQSVRAQLMWPGYESMRCCLKDYLLCTAKTCKIQHQPNQHHPTHLT